MLRLLVATLLVLAACSHGAPRTLTVEPIDCAELRADGVCEVNAGARLGLWVHGPRASLRALIAGEEVPLLPGNSDTTGFVVRVDVPTRMGELTLQGESSRGRLVLARHALPSALVEARAHRSAHELDRAEATLAPLLETSDAATRARALGLLARIQLSRDRIPEAVAGLRHAIAADERAGLLTTASADRLALGDTLYRRQNALAEARDVLTAMDARVLGCKPWAEYQLGLLASATGNAREALERLDRAETRARLFALPELAVDAADIKATVYSALGRHQQALRVIESTVPDADPCVRAAHLANLGWVRYQAAAAGERPFDDAASLEAVALFEGACPNGWERDNALLNVALARAARGAYEEALALLERASRGAAPGYVVEAYRAELRAELLVQAGNYPAGLEAYDALLAQAGGSAPLSSRYRAEIGRGRALRKLGHNEAAIEAFTRAEALLARQERLVPLGEGHGAFLTSHQGASTELVDLLLALARPHEALDVVRRARARLLSAFARSGRLAQLDDGTRKRWESQLGVYRVARDASEAHAARAWSVPADERKAFAEESARLSMAVERSFDAAMAVIGDVPRSELPALRPRDALLTVQPLLDGFAAFFAFEERVVVTRFAALDTADPAFLSRVLLGPHADVLPRARTLRVLSGGAFDDVAVHALPFDGGVLLERVPVVYALDLAVGGPHVLSGADESLLVTDPRGDLPMARGEASVAERALSTRSEVRRLAGAEATLSALRAPLAKARWFHYAGHAELSQKGMLESELLLADRSVLALSDVLALPHVPELVVLSACESSKTYSSGRAGGALATLGLAQAFVLAGSHAVLATRAAVPDRLAFAMSQALYGQGFRGELGALEMQRAALALRTSYPNDWSLYRLVVP